MKNITLADKAGFCFGVKRAVDEAINQKFKFNKRIYTLGPLIHNNDVVDYLKDNNIYPLDLNNIDMLNKGDVIIIRSHGIPYKTYELLRSKELIIIDATCPHVTSIHKKVSKYHINGYKIIIVGDKDHPEVIGINGWCEDSAIISKDGSNIKEKIDKACIVSQTTEKQENYQRVLESLMNHSNEIVAFNTICAATQFRQQSARELSKKVDFMIVLGGKNSSNTTKLYEICKENCKDTLHVENAGDIPADKIKIYKNIGVTAGASTPDWIIKEAIIKMNENKDLEMNEQLMYMEKNSAQIIVGTIIKGSIISVNDKEAYINIGYKADGLLPKSEVTKDDTVKLTSLFKDGDEIEVKIISRRNEDGYVVLSRIELEREEAYKELKGAFENKTPITVSIKENVKGGLVASYRGIRVFLPASHVELYHVEDLNDYVNKDLIVNIIEYTDNKKRGIRIVASRRELLKSEKENNELATWELLQEGNVVDGEVRRLTDFGAFVDVNGVDGLLHVSEISWGRINKPSDVLKVGDKVKVYILNIDKENKKLSLSMKKLLDEPWNNVELKYPVGNVVLGKVVRFASFGAFIELEPGIDGLVHISQISHKRINQPADALTIGQQIKAKILDVNKEDKKIALSIKEVDEIE